MDTIVVGFVCLLVGAVLATLYHTQIANAELKAEAKYKALLTAVTSTPSPTIKPTT